MQSSKYLLWGKEAQRVEDMTDQHVLNALKRVREIFDDLDAKIDAAPAWQTDNIEKWNEQLQDMAKWEGWFIEVLSERGVEVPQD